MSGGSVFTVHARVVLAIRRSLGLFCIFSSFHFLLSPKYFGRPSKKCAARYVRQIEGHVMALCCFNTRVWSHSASQRDFPSLPCVCRTHLAACRHLRNFQARNAALMVSFRRLCPLEYNLNKLHSRRDVHLLLPIHVI